MKWARTGFVLSSLICSPGSAEEPRGTSPTSATADVEEWMRANPAPIRTLAQFRAIPREMERRVFMTLPADVQFRLWKEKLAQAIASVELDERQLGIVAAADCFMTPELYSRDLTRETEDFLQELETDARAVFSTERFEELFLSLGNGLGSPEDFAPVAAVLPAGDCECNTGSDYCGGNSNCQRTGGRCTVTRGGCGFLWVYLCNGMCKRGRVRGR